MSDGYQRSEYSKKGATKTGTIVFIVLVLIIAALVGHFGLHLY